MPRWGGAITDADRREQLKLIYDYVKFHMGLYLATPTLVALVAKSLAIEASYCFLTGLGLMILTYGVSGAHASFFMARHVNNPWQNDFLQTFESDAFSSSRRFMHHVLYWVGLGFGLLGLLLAFAAKHGEVGCLMRCRGVVS